MEFSRGGENARLGLNNGKFRIWDTVFGFAMLFLMIILSVLLRSYKDFIFLFIFGDPKGYGNLVMHNVYYCTIVSSTSGS